MNGVVKHLFLYKNLKKKTLRCHRARLNVLTKPTVSLTCQGAKAYMKTTIWNQIKKGHILRSMYIHPIPYIIFSVSLHSVLNSCENDARKSYRTPDSLDAVGYPTRAPIPQQCKQNGHDRQQDARQHEDPHGTLNGEYARGGGVCFCWGDADQIGGENSLQEDQFDHKSILINIVAK